MKVRSLLLVGTTLFGTVLLSSLERPVSAATISFADFSNISAWKLNGSARTAVSGSQTVLRLVTATTSQTGSGFVSTPITVNNQTSFSAFFQFNISNSDGPIDSDNVRGADGFVFALTTAPDSLGGNESGLGYSGIGNSIGVEFDTWNNGAIDQNNGNHIGIDLNGNVASSPLVGVPQILNNGSVYSAWVDYDGSTDNLEVRFSNTNIRPTSPLLSKTVDLSSIFTGGNVFVGFTAATGAGYGDYDIRNFTFSASDPASTPEPGTVLGLLALGLLGAGSALIGQRK